MKEEIHQMNHFLRKMALRLGILLVIWLLLTQLMPRRWYLGADYLRWEVVFEHLDNTTMAHPKSVIIGDSRPEMGIRSKMLGAVNYGLGGTSPVEGHYIWTRLEELKIDTVYLSYGPYHFQTQDCFHSRSDFYDFIPQDFIREVKDYAEKHHDLAFLEKNWDWLDALEAKSSWEWVQNALKYIPSLTSWGNYKWYFANGEARKKVMEEEMLSNPIPVGECPRDSTAMEVKLEEEAGGFEVSPTNHRLFEMLTAALKKAEVQVIWVNMPLSEATRQPSEQYFADFEEYVKSMLPTGAIYIDFETWEACQFHDFSHLNADGAEAFTRSLKRQLEEMRGHAN